MRNKKPIPKVEEKTEVPQEETIDNSQPEGVIFDTITYYKSSDLDNFINNLSKEQAVYCVIQACQSAFKRNAYSIVEAELLSKAIRKLTSE